MRFSTAIFASFIAIAYAQDATTTSVAAPATTLDAVTECLNACDKADVSCRAKCVPVPNPTEEMISANNECIADCPTSDGTEAGISAYSTCRDACIAAHYYNPTGTLVGESSPDVTDSANNSNTTGGTDSEDTDSESSENSESESSENSEDTEDDNNTNGSSILTVSSAIFGAAAFIAGFAVV